MRGRLGYIFDNPSARAKGINMRRYTKDIVIENKG